MTQTGHYSNPPIFKAWILFTVLTVVVGFVAGAIVGFMIGLVLGATGAATIEEIQLYAGIGGFLAGLPVSYFMFRWSVNTFIVPNVWPAYPPPPPPTPAQWPMGPTGGTTT